MMKKITIKIRNGNTETIIRHAMLVKLEIADDETKIWYRDEGITARPEDIKFVSGHVDDVTWQNEVDNLANKPKLPQDIDVILEQPFDWEQYFSTSKKDSCQTCPYHDGLHDVFGNPVVGDSPCQWCPNSKWRTTC